jgi:hypothetical protein
MEFLQHAIESVAHGSLAFGAGVAALFGVLFHLSIRPLEFERIMYHFMLTSIVAFSGMIYVFGFLRAVVFATSFNTALLTSITVYRLAFHRCRKFPGPIGAKISKFYATRLSAKNVQYYKELAKMHEDYGDFVRTGEPRLQRRFQKD